MRKIRQSGSEGGEAKAFPTPIELINITGFRVALRLPGTRDLKGYDKKVIATQYLRGNDRY